MQIESKVRSGKRLRSSKNVCSLLKIRLRLEAQDLIELKLKKGDF